METKLLPLTYKTLITQPLADRPIQIFSNSESGAMAWVDEYKKQGLPTGTTIRVSEMVENVLLEEIVPPPPPTEPEESHE